MGKARTTLEGARDRFFQYIMYAPDGCWLWSVSLTSTGYGQIWVGERNRKAHQFSYEIHRGAVPDGLQLDHLCRQKTCVNPWHLEPVTMRENIERGIAVVGHAQARKTHCPKGHEYTAENTYRYPAGSQRPNGRRECRMCSREYKARWSATHERDGSLKEMYV